MGNPADERYVVINHEEQYSIWPADEARPRGWSEVGRSQSLGDARAYIEEVWTDMRPLSVIRTRNNRFAIAPADGNHGGTRLTDPLPLRDAIEDIRRRR